MGKPKTNEEGDREEVNIIAERTIGHLSLNPFKNIRRVK